MVVSVTASDPLPDPEVRRLGEIRIDGDVVEIPIVEEVLVKRPVVREVIRIRKDVLLERGEVDAVLRREEVLERLADGRFAPLVASGAPPPAPRADEAAAPASAAAPRVSPGLAVGLAEFAAAFLAAALLAMAGVTGAAPLLVIAIVLAGAAVLAFAVARPAGSRPRASRRPPQA